MPQGLKVRNEYAAALGDFYKNTPKAVFAALAFSYASISGGYVETADAEEIVARLTREWDVLWQNGIIPQKAPTAKVK